MITIEFYNYLKKREYANGFSLGVCLDYDWFKYSSYIRLSIGLIIFQVQIYWHFRKEEQK
jgi:hypothetical protein